MSEEEGSPKEAFRTDVTDQLGKVEAFPGEEATELTETSFNRSDSIGNMEVHHHPDLHHKKRRLREYLLEFLMIFLAVTLGFFAESLRESIANRAREKEFIKSMIVDAQTDTANIQECINRNRRRILGLDSLERSCFTFNASDSATRKLFILYRRYNHYPDIISVTDRTMSQLKNAGGMQMIKNETVLDSIILYDNYGKKLVDQQGHYEDYLNKTEDKAGFVFNFKYLQIDPVKMRGKMVFDSFPSVSLLTQNKNTLIEFGNIVQDQEGIIIFYIIRLEEVKLHAINLMKVLRREYNLQAD
jgi:hypothetical protein